MAENQAAVRFTARRKEPATGKTQRTTVLLLRRLEGGKFAEDWQLADPWEDEA